MITKWHILAWLIGLIFGGSLVYCKKTDVYDEEVTWAISFILAMCLGVIILAYAVKFFQQ